MKIGVIGAGYWGPKVARNFYELEGAELAWVSDLSEERLDHISSLYPGVRTTTDYRRMFDSNVDAVAIATPASTHHCLAMAALQAGKHVLVEKPLARTADEAAEIVAEGKRRHRIVMAGHTFEYNPAVQVMKDIIESCELGEIYYIDCVRVNLGLFQRDINVMWDLAPHDISILLYTLNSLPLEVSARGGAYVQRRQGIHDVVNLTLRFPNETMAGIRVSWLDPNKIRRYTVVGSKKMLVYDDVAEENKIMIYDKKVDVPPYSDTEEEFRISYHYGDVHPYPVPWVEPLRLACQHFVDCCATGAEPRSNGIVGMRVVEVLEAAQASLVDGGCGRIFNARPLDQFVDDGLSKN